MADEEALKTLRAVLEQARQHLDFAIFQLKANEEVRYLRWRCRRCEYIKCFTRPMPEHVAPPCPKCHGDTFEPVP